MITTVIFDIGGVFHNNLNNLIKEDISRVLDIPLDVVENAWQELIPTLYGRGLITEQQFWTKFKVKTKSNKKLPKYSLLTKGYKNNISINPLMLKLVKALKKKNYKLGIISDTISNHADVMKKSGLFNYFDSVLLSYKEGLRKPEKEFYELALKKLKSKPSETVYIDDNPELVGAAIKIGINGIVFTDYQGLVENLTKYGILGGIEKEQTNIGTHAILLTKDKKNIILQLRDTKPGISMFGGTIKKGEILTAGLRREIMEELNIDVNNYDSYFLKKYLKSKELDGVDYEIYVYVINNVIVSNLELYEGKGFYVESIDNALKNRKLTRITKLALIDLKKKLF